MAVLTPLGVVWWYTRPAQLIPVVEQALFESTGCEATIEHATVNTSGELVLHNVTLRVPGVPEPFARFMTVEKIEMVGEARGLIDGSYRPSRIDLVKPTLHLTEQADTGRFNYELLSAPEGGDAERPIPQITIRDGRLRFDQLRGERLTTLGKMGVKGELSPDPRVKKAYVFRIVETDAPAGMQNIAFTGGFDLKKPSLDMAADHFRFSDEQRYFVPGEFRRWWTRLSPTGEVPAMSLALRPNAAGKLDLHEVRLTLRDVGLNLDVLDLDDPEQRDIALLLKTIQSRLTRLSGEIAVDDSRFTLTGSGRIEQQGLGLSPVVYDVSASGGMNEGDAFRVDLQTRPFNLSPRYQFGLAFSPLTGEGYRRFRPSGKFKLSASLDQPAGADEVQWGIDLDVLNGKMTHAMFPVPLENVKGRIHIAADRVDIGPMTARAINGAKVDLEGFAKPASDVAEVKLDVNIKGLPIDNVLKQALEPDARENIGRFFDQAAYEKLLKRGLVVPTDAPADDATDGGSASTPRFTLGGKCDVYVPVHRPYGEGKDYSVTPVVEAKGLSLLMTDFPYPVTAQRGRITLGKDFVNIDGLAVRSPTGGSLRLNGSAKKGEDGVYRPQVSLRNGAMPIDPLLLSAIGPEAEALLTDLRVDGGLTVGGEVYQTPGMDEPGLALDVNVNNASTRPYGGRVRVDAVNGSFKLRAEGLDRLDLKGRRGEATVGISGSVDWSDDDRTAATLRFTPSNMRWSPELVDVLPPDGELHRDLDELYAEYQPEGAFDATIDWATKGGDTEDDFTAVVRPKDLALNLLGGRMRFTEMSGRAVVYSELMQLDQLRGTFADPGQPDGRGTLQASGDIGFDKNPRIGLTFSGRAHTASQTTRLLLPDAVTSILDTIDYQGLLEVNDAELSMTATGGDDQATDFDATFALRDTQMEVGGVAVEGLTGSLGVSVKDAPGEAMAEMAYTLSAEQMWVVGRKIERFRVTADNKANRSVLRAGRGTGSMYGGTVVFESSMDLAAEGGVRLRASIHDVRLEPMIKADQAETNTETDAPTRAARVVDRGTGSGLVSASLLLNTAYDPAGPRYGRGALRFREAGLLSETPLGLLVVQTLGLSIPDQRGFDRGAANFDIRGNAVHFNELWMENRGTELKLAGKQIYSQGLRIAGGGTMTVPDTRLDLRLDTQRTGTTARNPLSDLFNTLFNEIAGIQVRGTLADPEVGYVLLRDTREALGGGKDKGGE